MARLDAETLAAYIDDRLASRGRLRVEAHLAACDECVHVVLETVRAQAASQHRCHPARITRRLDGHRGTGTSVH